MAMLAERARRAREGESVTKQEPTKFILGANPEIDAAFFDGDIEKVLVLPHHHRLYAAAKEMKATMSETKATARDTRATLRDERAMSRADSVTSSERFEISDDSLNDARTACMAGSFSSVAGVMSMSILGIDGTSGSWGENKSFRDSLNDIDKASNLIWLKTTRASRETQRMMRETLVLTVASGAVSLIALVFAILTIAKVAAG